MSETRVTRRAFATGAAGALAIPVAASGSRVAKAQEETTTSPGGGGDSGGSGGTGGGGGGGGQHGGGEAFRLGRDLQLMLAAVGIAVLSPVVFAVLLFARGERGRGPDE